MAAAQTRPAKKTTAPRRDKPAPVAFNFDTYQRDVAVEPFAIAIGGQRHESIDPLDLDFRVLNQSLDDPETMFRLLFPDAADAILENAIPLGALAGFTAAVSTHFGLEDFIAALS